MPHIITEYSENLEDQIDLQNLVEKLYKALADEGIDSARIKSRTVELEHYVCGNKDSMLHVTLLLLEGRDIPTKKQYGDALYEVAKAAAPENCSVTLEIRDMAKDTYYQ